MKSILLYLALIVINDTNAKTISLTFTGGPKFHIDVAKVLHSYGINATFYLNSQLLGFITGYLNVFDVHWLVQNGFEIGGNGLLEIDLTQENSPTIIETICRDRARLIANSWIPVSFHHPLGKYNSLTNKITRECGYSNAIGIQNETSIVFIQNEYELPYIDVTNQMTFQQLVDEVFLSKGFTIFNFRYFDITENSPVPRFINWLIQQHIYGNIVIKSVDSVVQGTYRPIPIEFANTPPTPTPDPDAELKIYIGTGCIGVLVILVLYVVITTQIKRRTKIKFAC